MAHMTYHPTVDGDILLIQTMRQSGQGEQLTSVVEAMGRLLLEGARLNNRAIPELEQKLERQETWLQSHEDDPRHAKRTESSIRTLHEYVFACDQLRGIYDAIFDGCRVNELTYAARFILGTDDGSGTAGHVLPASTQEGDDDGPDLPGAEPEGGVG